MTQMISGYSSVSWRWLGGDESDAQPGDVLHLVQSRAATAPALAGIDRPRALLRRRDYWGDAPVDGLIDALRAAQCYPRALTPAGAVARGWGLARDVVAVDPPAVAAIAPPPGALVGLCGARRGRHSVTHRYDLTAAYPAAACRVMLPDWRYMTVTVSRAETERLLARGAIGVVQCDADNAPPGLLPDATHWPWAASEARGRWLTTIDVATLRDAGARVACYRGVLASRGRHWEWYRRVFERLWQLRLDDAARAAVWKLAANGLIGRLAAGGIYELARLSRGAGGGITDGIYVRAGTGWVARQTLETTRRPPRSWLTTAMVIAAVRRQVWDVITGYGGVWWWVDAVTTTAPLPPSLVGREPGQWRPVGVGPAAIRDWRGGLIAGASVVASLPRARWSAFVASAFEASN